MQISVTDLIKYFAKFPNRDGVLKLFNKNVLPAPMSAEYTAVKQYIEALPEQSLIPELEALVFGLSEDVVDRIVSSTDGFFMMVEYGPVRGSVPDRTGRRDADWKLSVIVGFHFNLGEYDPITELVVMDKCMQYLLQIVEQIEEDEYPACPLKRFNEGAIHFTPINPTELYESIGWMTDFSETIQAVV